MVVITPCDFKYIVNLLYSLIFLFPWLQINFNVKPCSLYTVAYFLFSHEKTFHRNFIFQIMLIKVEAKCSWIMYSHSLSLCLLYIFIFISLFCCNTFIFISSLSLNLTFTHDSIFQDTGFQYYKICLP